MSADRVGGQHASFAPAGLLLLYFHLVAENVDTDQLIWLLRLLHRHYRRHVVVVWDRLGAHRSAAA